VRDKQPAEKRFLSQGITFAAHEPMPRYFANGGTIGSRPACRILAERVA
jgi:hypothetical protein